MTDTPWSTLLERFEARTERTDSCWNWTAGSNKWGYGFLRSREKLYYAHRFSYLHFVGPIADGMTIDHLCRNRRCVNPAHLEPVTRGENCLRGVGGPAVNARKTACINGHPFDGLTKRGTRFCKTCRLAWQQRQKQAPMATG